MSVARIRGRVGPRTLQVGLAAGAAGAAACAATVGVLARLAGPRQLAVGGLLAGSVVGVLLLVGGVAVAGAAVRVLGRHAPVVLSVGALALLVAARLSDGPRLSQTLAPVVVLLAVLALGPGWWLSVSVEGAPRPAPLGGPVAERRRTAHLDTAAVGGSLLLFVTVVLFGFAAANKLSSAEWRSGEILEWLATDESFRSQSNVVRFVDAVPAGLQGVLAWATIALELWVALRALLLLLRPPRDGEGFGAPAACTVVAGFLLAGAIASLFALWDYAFLVLSLALTVEAVRARRAAPAPEPSVASPAPDALAAPWQDGGMGARRTR